MLSIEGQGVLKLPMLVTLCGTREVSRHYRGVSNVPYDDHNNNNNNNNNNN